MANNIEPQGREELPVFQSDGFVKETGLAVVQEGEYDHSGSWLRGHNRNGAKPGQTL
jgi:hypothetical protein